MQNSFSYERFRTYTRFETEAQENSEMAYSEHGDIVISGPGQPQQNRIFMFLKFMKGELRYGHFNDLAAIYCTS